MNGQSLDKEYDMKNGDTIKVRTNTNGWVDAEVIENRTTTVKVRLLHDGNVITRKKSRDLKEQ